MLRRQRKLSHTAYKYAGDRKTKTPQNKARYPRLRVRKRLKIEYMCGIIGYTGAKRCVPILIEGLKTLEYRGYDSAGVTVADDGGLVTVKSKGRLTDLEDKLGAGRELLGSCGIGHTRWATHGEPSDQYDPDAGGVGEKSIFEEMMDDFGDFGGGDDSYDDEY